ncbi:MAG: ABC transporter permease [Gammaproteobacteria bacterium]|nr:ABC transporter permease [Gammaproteobacteria bacterium]
MLGSYFLIAIRNLVRERLYATINLVGLSLAIACSLILVLYLRSELTYDQYHRNHEHIYKIANDYTTNGVTTRYSISSAALGPLFFREYPDVGDFVRIRDSFVDNRLFRYGARELYWQDVMMADDNVFDVFTHELVYGTFEDALVDPYSMVLSESFSIAYFGEENPVGRVLSTDSADYTVKAVFKDFPDNVHLKYSALLSWNLVNTVGQGDETRTPESMYTVAPTTYFHMNPAVSAQELQRLLDDFHSNVMAEHGLERGTTVNFHPMPLLDVHFDNRFVRGPATGNIFYIYGFVAVAAFILLVACINYTNLAIALGMRRAKEVGMRKILGANRSQLITQFVGESICYALLALVIGLMIVELVERYTPITGWLGKSYLLQFSTEMVLIAWIIVGTLAIGILAGAYPAFYLSFIEPVNAISGSRKSRSSIVQLRHILTFVQFIVSVSVIACTLMMLVQMNYVASRPLGYDIENRILIKLRGADVIERIPVIRNELFTNPAVLGVTETSFVPGVPPGNAIVTLETSDGVSPPVRLPVGRLYSGVDFIEVMGLEMVLGESFAQRSSTAEGSAVIVNESLVAQMGWENPIGKQIFSLNSTVIGVMKDFHAESLHRPILPIMLSIFRPPDSAIVQPLDILTRDIVISISGSNMNSTLAHIERVMTSLDPEHPFEFQFFENTVDQQYRSELQLMNLTGVFAAICIVVSCLGLFGLSALTTQQRTREIGIRKVLGATAAQIVMLLARFQVVIVIVASVFASVLSYVVMNIWMSGFTYRADIPLWPFLAATLGVAALAFLTIALHSVATAHSNPVQALRCVQ